MMLQSVNAIQSCVSQIKLNVFMPKLLLNWQHIQQFFMFWFRFHSMKTVCGDLWSFSATHSFAVQACFPSFFHLWLANKTRRYNHPLWPLNLTARLLNTWSIRLRQASQFSLFFSLYLFPPLSSPPVPPVRAAPPSLHLPELLWPCLNPLNSQPTAVYPPGNTADASNW